MAEEKDVDVSTEEGAEGTQKSKSKLLIIIIAAVVVLAGAGAGAYFVLAGGEKAEAGAEEGHEAAAAEHGADAAAGGHGAPGGVGEVVYYELPEILVNLSSTNGMNRFLKMKVNLELKSEQDKQMIEKVLPRIIDDYQLYLRQLRVEDLTGAQGVQRLKEALLIRANQAARPLEIQAVLFKEILVQ